MRILVLPLAVAATILGVNPTYARSVPDVEAAPGSTPSHSRASDARLLTPPGRCRRYLPS